MLPYWIISFLHPEAILLNADILAIKLSSYQDIIISTHTTLTLHHSIAIKYVPQRKQKRKCDRAYKRSCVMYMRDMGARSARPDWPIESVLLCGTDFSHVYFNQTHDLIYICINMRTQHLAAAESVRCVSKTIPVHLAGGNA